MIMFEATESAASVLDYLTKLTQANLLVGLICIIGLFVTLMCIAVVDRKIGYLKSAVKDIETNLIDADDEPEEVVPASLPPIELPEEEEP